MIEEQERARRLRTFGNGAAALVAAVLVLTVLGAGLPALGPGLVPGHGEWKSAAPAGQEPRR
jgi:hypothetical protein